MQRTKQQHTALLIGLLLKVAVAGTLFAIVAFYVDIADALKRIGQADLGLFLFATGLMIAQLFFTTARWCVVVRALGYRLPFSDALVSYLLASFFNQALPSTLGGDAIRVWRSSKRGMGLGPATVSVVVDRAFGLLTLALLSIFGAVVLWLNPAGEMIALGVGFAIAAIVVGAIVGSTLSTLFPRLLEWRLGRPLYRLSDGVKRVVISLRYATLVLLFSLLGHLLTVIAFGWLAASLGIVLGFDGALTTLPVILLAAAVPVSINGWGVREGVGVVVLGLISYSAEEAFAVTFLFGVSLLLIGLIGGVVWLLADSMAEVPLANR